MKTFQTFKWRKIILILLTISTIVMIAISVANTLIVENKIADTVWLIANKTTMMKKLSKAIGPIIWVVMLVFAHVYTFKNKEEEKKIMWPFIVIVVIASITVAGTFISVVWDKSEMKAQNLNGIFDINLALGYTLLVTSTIVLGLAITNLVQVSKFKKINPI